MNQSSNIIIETDLLVSEIKVPKIQEPNPNDQLLPPRPPKLVREQTEIIFRPRVEDEKYFLQAIKGYNEAGEYTDTGFVQLNDYTNCCKMVRVLNKSETSLHFFRRWQHYQDQFFETPFIKVMDLTTGICCRDTHTIDDLEKDTIQCSQWGLIHINKVKGEEVKGESRRPFYGDLKCDLYSKALLQCIEERTKQNRPQHVIDRLKHIETIYTKVQEEDQDQEEIPIEMKRIAQQELETVIKNNK